MPSMTDSLSKKRPLTREEALALYDEDFDSLCASANAIRRDHSGDHFDLCTVVSAKNGHCSEDCAFCAQSRLSRAEVAVRDLIRSDILLKHAKRAESAGIYRYSLVFSGRKISKKEIDAVAERLDLLKRETSLHLCISGGLLDREDLIRLKAAGLERLHNNLETSRAHFPALCSSHTYDEKIKTLRIARDLGIELCSGAILGVGESRKDRIELAFTLRDLGVKSVPLNILHAVEGTPLAENRVLEEEEILRTFAVFRHILPDASIRLAGGRIHLKKDGEKALDSGADAAITGDFLNTCGSDHLRDLAMARKRGLRIAPDPRRSFSL